MSSPINAPPSVIAHLFQEQRRAAAFLANARVVVAQASFGFGETLREWSFLGKIYNRINPSDLKAQLTRVLDEVQKTLENCEPNGSVGRRLSAGLTTPKAYADVLNASMSSVVEVVRAADQNSFTVANLWREVAVPTLAEARETAEKLADRGQSLVSTLAVIAVAVAVIYVASKVSR